MYDLLTSSFSQPNINNIILLLATIGLLSSHLASGDFKFDSPKMKNHTMSTLLCFCFFVIILLNDSTICLGYHNSGNLPFIAHRQYEVVSNMNNNIKLSSSISSNNINHQHCPLRFSESPFKVYASRTSNNKPHHNILHSTVTTAIVEDVINNDDEKSTITDDKIVKDDIKIKKKKFVVVGAGWAGWGAAKALCESGMNMNHTEIIILDSLYDPTGRTPYLSSSNKPVEAGTRGFWKDYPNIYNLCNELKLNENDIFSEYTNSSFYSPDGLEATAPVFSKATLPKLPPFFNDLPFIKEFSEQTLPILPSPLGQVLATFTLFERLPIQDRISMIGLLIATVDCLGSDESVQASYDRMTAHELFIRFGLSIGLVEDFIKPTLLVGLFKPPEELSALVVMELLYYYALAHMDSFDVRWIKNGTVSDSLIAPLATYLQDKYDLNVLGGCRVGTISCTTNSDNGMYTASSLQYYNTKISTIENIDNIDGIVLALTCNGMKSVVNASPDLAQFPVFSKAASCTGIDVISVRIWLDQFIPTRTPANVFSRYDVLRGAGGTFFMLDQLQNDNIQQLWNNETVQGSVVACDFYNAGALLSLPDHELIKILMEDLLPSAVIEFADANVVDSWVGKYPGAVSWFAPGTYDKRPPLEGAGNALSNVKCAGDWIRLGEREHGAKGLCQERAYVTGLEAANSLLRSMNNNDKSSVNVKTHNVLPVREDEIQFRTAIELNKNVMKILPRFWIR